MSLDTMMSNADTIIFLDFDGVLHSYESGPYEDEIHDGSYINKKGIFKHVDKFSTMLRKFNADIILSTSWRTAISIKNLRSAFPEDIQRRIIDITPDINDDREIEILEKAKKLKKDGFKGDFIALDDVRDYFNGPRLSHDPLVKHTYIRDKNLEIFIYIVDGDTGLTTSDINVITSFLTPDHRIFDSIRCWLHNFYIPFIQYIKRMTASNGAWP